MTRTKALLASLSLITLSGCSSVLLPDETDAATEQNTSSAPNAGPVDEAALPATPVTSLAQIEGYWLVERFNDFRPSWRDGTPWRRAYVQIGEDGLSYSIGCNHSGRSARIDDDGRLRDKGDGPYPQTLMGCGKEVEARDGRFFGSFGQEPSVQKLGDDRVMFTSRASELVLVDPETWRLANAPQFSEIEGRWVPEMAMEHEGWGHTGYGITESPGVITIARDRLVWSVCPDRPIPIEWSDDKRLSSSDAAATPCTKARSDNPNGPGTIWPILTGNPAVLRMSENSIVMFVGSRQNNRALYLRSEESILNPPDLPPPPPDGQTPPPPPPAPPPAR